MTQHYIKTEALTLSIVSVYCAGVLVLSFWRTDDLAVYVLILGLFMAILLTKAFGGM